jgi:hypothetical protein
VGKLVLADRHGRSLAEQDVSRLMHGVGEHQARHRGLTGRDYLVLDGRVAFDLRDAHQAQERQEELVERLDLGVRENGCALGVDAHREVVGDKRVHVLRQGLRTVAIRDRLVVRDQHEQLDAELL